MEIHNRPPRRSPHTSGRTILIAYDNILTFRISYGKATGAEVAAGGLYGANREKRKHASLLHYRVIRGLADNPTTMIPRDIVVCVMW